MDKDYFSAQADIYRQFRPTYPTQLFDYLLRHTAPRPLVWDCATGNGQAATALAARARVVVATDQSREQLRQAPARPGVHYVQAAAEAAPLPDRCVDLLTIAQALHWFDFERFYREVNRVLRPGALVAAWTYSFLAVTPQLGPTLDAVVQRFYHEVIGPYWPPERRWVDDNYRTIPLPFEALDAPPFRIEVNWDLDAIVGYIASWSAVQAYRQARNEDPMPALAARLAAHWGKAHACRPLSWPLGLRVARVAS